MYSPKDDTTDIVNILIDLYKNKTYEEEKI